MRKFWTRFRTDDRGQDMIEYTLILAFVARASAALFATTGRSVNAIWLKANPQLSAAAGS